MNISAPVSHSADPSFASGAAFCAAGYGLRTDRRWPPCFEQQGLLAGQATAMSRQLPSIHGPARRTFSGQGQARHLAVHERRAEPGRYLGLQARAGQARRPGAEGLRQEHRLLHRPGRAADEVAVQVRAARRSAARGSRRSFPNMAEHVDDMAFIHSCFTEIEQPLARPCSRSTPA